jgi:hypothetical protein
MTAVAPENKQETILKQDQVDTNLHQQKVDTDFSQQQGQEKIQKTLEDDENFKAFREGRKKDRLEREAAERRAAEKEEEAAALKAAMDAAFSAKPNYQQHQYIEPTDESEDQKIEKKVNAIIAQREAFAAKEKIEREMQEYPNRLSKDFPDFHHVISQENRDYLDYHYPEISRPLSRLQDGYEKWSDIYHAIKKLVPNSSTAKREAQKAEINQAKPRSMSGATVTQPSPTTAAHIISEERKAANWARMTSSIKGVG